MKFLTTLLIVISIISLILFIICYLSIKIEILLKRENENDRGEIIFSTFFGLIYYKVKIPSINFRGFLEGVNIESSNDGDNIFSFEHLKKFFKVQYQFLENHVNLHETTKWFLSKISCEKLAWNT